MGQQPPANELFRAAQVLIREGNPVFPCKSVGAKAKAPIGALVPNGVNDATLDVALVKSWWKRARGASIGIATGFVWDVLDVDTKEGSDGRLHLYELQQLGLLNGCKRVVRTPSGGLHLYFRAATGLTNKAASASLGLDVRAKGGYVLAPPSFLLDAERADGSTYSGAYEDLGMPTNSNDDPLWWNQIVNSLAPRNNFTNKEIAVLPSERRASLASLREWTSNLRPGERNNGLHWAVCRCIENGIDPHELVDPGLLTGLPESEILTTVRSALQRAGVDVNELDTEAEALFPDDN